jgi:hypothetical protein
MDELMFSDLPPRLMELMPMFPALGLPSPSLHNTLANSSDSSIWHFSRLLGAMSSIALDGQVSYNDFAERFSDMWVDFQEVVKKERRVRADAVSDNRGE